MKIFIFRRDFRICDNTAFLKCLYDAIEEDDDVLPLFIYNDDQIKAQKNQYFSNNAMQFLVESLNDLNTQIQEIGGKIYKLHISKTEDENNLIQKIFESFKKKKEGKRCVLYFNKDLTPFARDRDELLIKNKNIEVQSVEDYTLFSVDEKKIKTQDETAYKVFSFLYKKHKKVHDIIPKINKLDKNKEKKIKWFSGKCEEIDKVLEKNDSTFYKENKNISVRGGRKNALKILESISKGNFKEYDETRDEIYNPEGTTRLSAYLKYGCISVREVYWAVYEKHGISHALIRELYFREFYYHIAWFHPHVLKGMKLKIKNTYNNQNENFNDIEIEWNTNKPNFEKWKTGKTGTPMVDAAMRQLNCIGFMHNRGRMIVAMYLTKDLMIDWRDGEKYFATKLVDYDPAQNNAGWQWSASTGSDSQPYFRIMNPYTQQERFDKDAKYIKEWIPELKDVKPKDLINWEKKDVRDKYKDIDYPAPIVENHTKTSKETIKIFKNAN